MGQFRQWQGGPAYSLRFVRITPDINTVEVTFEVPELDGTVRLTITNSRTRRFTYETFQIYRLRPANHQITHRFTRLDADQDYTIELSYIVNRQQPILVQDRTRTLPAPVVQRAPRCSELIDKIRVVATRMSHSLHYSKINHLLKKLMEAISTRFFAEQNPPRQINPAATRAQRLANEDIYEAIRAYLRPAAPMHIELYHILLAPPSQAGGGTAAFLARFFPNMTVQQRRDFFRQGFPGGDAEYEVFLRTLLRNSADYDLLVQNEQDIVNGKVNNNGVLIRSIRPDKKVPALRFVFRGSGRAEADPDFGYIFVTNREGGQNPLVDDQERILIHLSMTIPYQKDAAGRPTQNYFEINQNPLTYHITDACFGMHLFYNFDTGDYVGVRPGNQINDDYINIINPIENADGSVTFIHNNAGAVGAGANQQITVSRDPATGNIIATDDGTGALIQFGGYRKRKEKGKTLRKRKAKKSRKARK